MNKRLTTITLLCFSVAANAETYVCITESYAEVTSDGSHSSNSSNDQVWVVDTNKGLRISLVDTYSGSCSKEGLIVMCKSDNGRAFQTIVINTAFLSFSLSLRNQEAVSRLISYTGNCIET